MEGNRRKLTRDAVHGGVWGVQDKSTRNYRKKAKGSVKKNMVDGQEIVDTREVIAREWNGNVLVRLNGLRENA